MTYDVFNGTLNPTQSINLLIYLLISALYMYHLIVYIVCFPLVLFSSLFSLSFF